MVHGVMANGFLKSSPGMCLKSSSLRVTSGILYATAVAAMEAIVRRRAPAPRAQAIVPATGGFLIDLTNAPTTTAFLQWLR